MNYIINISLILIFSNFLISESGNDKDLPPRFDLSKGINLGSVLPKSMTDKLYAPVPEYMLDKIKENAKNFVPEPVTDNDIIIFETTLGTFEAVFYNDHAPNHCLNFKKLANSGFYDGTRFHRSDSNFMIQGVIFYLEMEIGLMMEQAILVGRLMLSLMTSNTLEGYCQWQDHLILTQQVVSFYLCI